MLVDHDRVVAEPIRQHQFLQVALIKLVAALGVIEFVGEVDPGRFELLVVFRQMHIGHEVHRVETKSTHPSPPASRMRWVRETRVSCQRSGEAGARGVGYPGGVMSEHTRRPALRLVSPLVYAMVVV